MSSIRPMTICAGFGFLAACLSASSLSAAQQTRADAEKDPILKAMLTELDRSMSQLQLPGFAKPFFIQYRIEDVDDFQTKAEFGASEGSDHAHQRVARVTVRVGDYKTDSSGGRGDGSLQFAALDDDPIAIRSALWSATDTAYKAALAAYAQKQAALKQVQTPPQADDFSHEKLRTLVYEETSLARRRLLHRRIAETLAGHTLGYREGGPLACQRRVRVCQRPRFERGRRHRCGQAGDGISRRPGGDGPGDPGRHELTSITSRENSNSGRTTPFSAHRCLPHG